MNNPISQLKGMDLVRWLDNKLGNLHGQQNHCLERFYKMKAPTNKKQSRHQSSTKMLAAGFNFLSAVGARFGLPAFAWRVPVDRPPDSAAGSISWLVGVGEAALVFPAKPPWKQVLGQRPQLMLGPSPPSPSFVSLTTGAYLRSTNLGRTCRLMHA